MKDTDPSTDKKPAPGLFHTFHIKDVCHGQEVPPLNGIANCHGVPSGVWASWPERSRRTFNVVFETMRDHQDILQDSPTPRSIWISYARGSAMFVAEMGRKTKQL